MAIGEVFPGDVGRRGMMKAVAGTALAGAALALPAIQARAQTLSDIDALNLMLNVNYLLAQFLSAATGDTVAPDRLTGNGVAGTPPIPGKRVTFTDPLLRLIVVEMAADNRISLISFRVVIGALSARQPLMDISAAPAAPFTVAMQRAGVIAAGTTFDPYASEENLLYSIYYLKNISVAALRGLAPTITNRVVTQNFTGLLGAECIHAATIRSYLYSRGATVPRLRDNSEKIAAYQRSLNGGVAFQGAGPMTRTVQGTGATVQTARIAPEQPSGEVAGRSAGQILNQLYLTSAAVTSGGFYPEGVNGNIRTSAST